MWSVDLKNSVLNSLLHKTCQKKLTQHPYNFRFIEHPFRKNLTWHGFCRHEYRSLCIQRGGLPVLDSGEFPKQTGVNFFLIGVVELWLQKKNTLTG